MDNFEPDLAVGTVEKGLWVDRRQYDGPGWLLYSPQGGINPVAEDETKKWTLGGGEQNFPMWRHNDRAITFHLERGRVLHLSWHFDQTFSDVVPEMGTSLRQAIFMNFIIAGLTSPSSAAPKLAQGEPPKCNCHRWIGGGGGSSR
jgi:hypothetical protein